MDVVYASVAGIHYEKHRFTQGKFFEIVLLWNATPRWFCQTDGKKPSAPLLPWRSMQSRLFETSKTFHKIIKLTPETVKTWLSERLTASKDTAVLPVLAMQSVRGLLYSISSYCYLLCVFCSLCLNYWFYVLHYSFYSFSCFVGFAFYYVCSVFLCIVLCIVCLHACSCIFSICIQVYWPLPPDRNSVAVNKYRIKSSHTGSVLKTGTLLLHSYGTCKVKGFTHPSCLLPYWARQLYSDCCYLLFNTV
jgi:hypothetical protein